MDIEGLIEKTMLYIQRARSGMDIFLSEAFSIRRMILREKDKGTTTVEFFYDFGPRICFIRPDGRVSRVTGFFSVTHTYGKDGELISRVPTLQTALDDDRIVIGDEAVEKAYQRSADLFGDPMANAAES